MKGLIVAAGYGTRFLPASKTMPKELFPLIDKPSIAFIIEEFIASGIRDIVLLTSRRKKSLEDYFDREIELETLFTREGAEAKLAKIKPYDINLTIVRQQQMLGTGHAMLQARSILEGSPFVTAYPDDLHFIDSQDAEQAGGGSTQKPLPLAKQLVNMYEKTGCSVLATLHDPPDILRYAVLALAEDGLHVTDMIEKPASMELAPSLEASIGRFLYTPDIFEHLQEGWEKHSGGEYYHVYGLKKLMDMNKVVFSRVQGTRLDTGAPEGYLQAIIRYAAANPALKKIILDETAKIKGELPQG